MTAERAAAPSVSIGRQPRQEVVKTTWRPAANEYTKSDRLPRASRWRVTVGGIGFERRQITAEAGAKPRRQRGALPTRPGMARKNARGRRRLPSPGSGALVVVCVEFTLVAAVAVLALAVAVVVSVF